MNKNVPNVDSVPVEMTNDNESELIAADVKYDVLAHLVNFLPEQCLHLAKVRPRAFLGQAIPHIERYGGLRMQLGKVQQFLSRDDMHASTAPTVYFIILRILRTVNVFYPCSPLHNHLDHAMMAEQ